MISRIRIFGRLVFENQRESPRWQTPPIVWAKNFWVCESKIEFVFEKISRFEIQCLTSLHFESFELTPHSWLSCRFNVCDRNRFETTVENWIRWASDTDLGDSIRHLYKRKVQPCDATRTQYSTIEDAIRRERHVESLFKNKILKQPRCPIQPRYPLGIVSVLLNFSRSCCDVLYRIESIGFVSKRRVIRIRWQSLEIIGNHRKSSEIISNIVTHSQG